MLSFSNFSKQSFEYDFFPEILKQNIKIKMIESKGEFIDIGTVPSFNQTSKFINDNINFFSKH